MSRRDLERIWRAGVEACLPERVVAPHLPEPPPGRTIALAVGKAAAGMAEALERDWTGELSGLAVAPHGARATLRRVELATAAHPVPDAASVAAAERLLGLAAGAGADDLVLLLLSGGASSLACLPGDGLSLGAKQALTDALLRSGASIGEINCIRRHLSLVKGGRLGLAALPARLVTVAISDVPGDRPEDIGSGPTAADTSTIDDARAVLARYGIEPPASGWSESVKALAGDWRVAASNAAAVAVAAREAERLGYRPVLLGEAAGEAREAGRAHAELALRTEGRCALISGGELSVTVRGNGRGGRNLEYALGAATVLGESDVHGLAADTDGIDGNSGAAGAFFGGAAAAGEDPAAALAANDSGAFFARKGALFMTGPTGTNVSDLRILLTAP